METNELVKLTVEQRNRLHAYYTCERERHRAAGEPLQMLRIDQRIREIAWAGLIALDRYEYAVAMGLEQAA